MRARVLVMTWMLGALVVGSPAGAQEQGWYAERMTTGDSPVRVEHLWSKGRKFKSVSFYRGHPIITLVNGPRYLIYDELTLKGIQITRSARAQKDDEKGGRPFGDEMAFIVENGGEKVRTEEVGGGTCDLYRLTDSEGRREVCVATANEEGQALPILLRVWLRASNRESETRYLEWNANVEFGEGFFEPDPRVALEVYEYEAYVEKIQKEAVGPAPPFHGALLHGRGLR